MRPSVHSLLANVGALGILAGTLFVVSHRDLISRPLVATNEYPSVQLEQTASVTNIVDTPEATEKKPAIEPKSEVIDTQQPEENIAASAAPDSESDPENTQITRLKNPYAFPSHGSDVLNQEARAALVNILCEASGDAVKSISGSGTIIDSRGIVATNAHVAQYVLLAKHSNIDISCKIRTGSPARDAWGAEILFFPSLWIDAHAKDIVHTRPKGTGEHDYALLRIVPLENGSALPLSFPYLEPDTRETIGFTGDSILIAAYPAEFGDSAATRNNLNVSTVFSNIKQMLTFSETSVDMISLGGTAVAQSGSSGGTVLNIWGRALGIIATTSEGETTAARDLRAITYAHIDRSIRTHTGKGLEDLLDKDPASQASIFKTEADKLASKLVEEIQNSQR
ncbi:trypsin-like peptidase domain-containing protein [Candidatus Kaiserbacteria bacterium]|nr:trypsin-like peptidase domain-containing protein [Candidatus Kaiserbacteria bacterium]